MSLVTAVLPTCGRPAMATAALQCALAQTWSAVEVLVIDDTDTPSFPEGLENCGVGYVRVRNQSLGDKLNLACAMANGEYVVHFHDDDFSAPGRIADQVARLEQTGKAVTNYRNLCFVNVKDGKRWRNTNWPGGFGTSLCHRVDWWQAGHHFGPQTSEDWEFVAEAMRANQFIAGEAGDLMQVLLHAGNNSSVIGPGWILS